MRKIIKTVMTIMLVSSSIIVMAEGKEINRKTESSKVESISVNIELLKPKTPKEATFEDEVQTQKIKKENGRSCKHK